ncbi:MAG: MCE family protein [Burkholderiales bacterium]|nr:MCE family protein [Burkholderiales bacterium]
MENKAHALAAGLFTLILGIALVAAAFWIRGEPIAHDAYVLHTKGSVSGLNAQAPVRYRGVEVGKVESIAFDPNDPRTILVGISVRSGTPLTRGAYGQLAAQGITGLSYVQLNDDGSSAALRDPNQPEQARIELRPSFLDRVSDSGEHLVARIALLTERLEEWLSADNRQQALRTLAAFETAAGGVTALAQRLQAGADSVPELARQARTTLANADSLMAEVRALAAALGQRAETLDRVAASAERIGSSVAELSRSANALAAAAGRETLPRINQTLDEIARNSRSLERLLGELNANPASLVFGRAAPVPGPGEPGFVHGAAR